MVKSVLSTRSSVEFTRRNLNICDFFFWSEISLDLEIGNEVIWFQTFSFTLRFLQAVSVNVINALFVVSLTYCVLTLLALIKLPFALTITKYNKLKWYVTLSATIPGRLWPILFCRTISVAIFFLTEGCLIGFASNDGLQKEFLRYLLGQFCIIQGKWHVFLDIDWLGISTQSGLNWGTVCHTPACTCSRYRKHLLTQTVYFQFAPGWHCTLLLIIVLIICQLRKCTGLVGLVLGRLCSPEMTYHLSWWAVEGNFSPLTTVVLLRGQTVQRLSYL